MGDDENDDDEDDLAPPLPPRRSESLLKSNFYNNGTQQQDSNPALTANLPDFLALQEQVNGSNECSTSSSENTPPDKNSQTISGGHQKLTSSVSAPLQDFKTDFFSDLQTSSKDSP